MKRLLLLCLAFCLVSCAAVQDTAGVVGVYPTTWGACGTLAISPLESVVPDDCVDETDKGICVRRDWVRGLCWMRADNRDRTAAIRRPVAGERVYVVTPRRAGVGRIIAVGRHRATVQFSCYYGDCGGVVWGEDGSALGLAVQCGLTTSVLEAALLVEVEKE